MATGRLGSPTSITGIVRQQTRSVISAQNFVPKPNVAISDVAGINVASVQNGQALIYSSTTGKFEANTISATITSLDGGRF
jgi:hypothetical protein